MGTIETFTYQSLHRDRGAEPTHFLVANGSIFVGKILKMICTKSGEREAETVAVESEFRMIEVLDFVVHFIDLRFNQQNFKAYEQLELLLLKALALASNDFADEIEYLETAYYDDDSFFVLL